MITRSASTPCTAKSAQQAFWICPRQDTCEGLFRQRTCSMGTMTEMPSSVSTMVLVTLRVLSVSCLVLYVRLRPVSARSGAPGSSLPVLATQSPSQCHCLQHACCRPVH